MEETIVTGMKIRNQEREIQKEGQDTRPRTKITNKIIAKHLILCHRLIEWQTNTYM